MAKRIDVYWEDIGPELAKQYLLLNKCNRPLKNTKIEEWAKEIKKGEWLQTHQGIAFDWDGNLIDGQNRLSAVVLSECTVRMLVTTNLDPKTFAVIDDGIARSGSDLFCVLYQRKHGEPPKDGVRVASIAYSMLCGLGKPDIHKEDSAAHALKHFDKISMLVTMSRPGWSGVQVAAAFANAMVYFGPDLITPLVLRFEAQQWDGPTDPLKALFTRLIKAAMAEHKRNKLSRVEKYSITVSAIRQSLTGAKHGKSVTTTQDFGKAPEDRKIKEKSR